LLGQLETRDRVPNVNPTKYAHGSVLMNFVRRPAFTLELLQPNVRRGVVLILYGGVCYMDIFAKQQSLCLRVQACDSLSMGGDE
jgi:hypothetical protein